MSESRHPAIAPRLQTLVSSPPAAVPVPASGLGAIILTVAAMALATMTTNPGPTVAAVISLALIVRWLWRPGLPPVLLFVCLMQWLQGAIMTLHADVMAVELRSMTYARHIDEATYYTLGWVSLIALGAYLATSKVSPNQLGSAPGFAMSMPRMLIVYGVGTLGLRMIEAVAPGQVRQFIQALDTLRWAIVYAIFVQGWSMPQARLIVLGVLSVEVAFGFLSFFSSFKTPLFLFAIALVSTGYRPTLRQYFVLSLVFVATLYFGVVWSSIKREYRNQLNGGRGAATQEVVLSTEERMDAFLGLVGSLDSRTLDNGATQLISRIAYVDYFAYVLGYVPRVVPHEDGRIWLNAFTHVLLPRALFPDKAELESDTVIAERYTGLDLGARDSATSITIGLPAETYVDLGPSLMFIVPLLLGLMYGIGYRHFMLKQDAGFIGQGVAVAMLVGFTSVGAAATKVLGGYVTVLVVGLLLWKFAWPALSRFLRVPLQPRSW